MSRRNPLRITRQRLREWGLVLSAMGIPFGYRRDNTGRPVIRVGQDARADAVRQIRLYEKEKRDQPVGVTMPRAVTVLYPGLLVFLGLYLFHFTVHILLPGEPFLQAGSANRELVLSGEWWRLVTALTLHADLGHVLANLIMLLIAGSALSGLTGAGAAYLLILLAGFAGGGINALVHQGQFASIGASTAVFAAFGILAAMQIPRRFQRIPGGMLSPFAAALGLLAVLGVGGQNTDIGGHLFGFAAGAVTGLLAGFFYPLKRPGLLAQSLCGITAIGLILASWALAWGIL